MTEIKIIAKANYLKGKKLHLPKLPGKNKQGLYRDSKNHSYIYTINKKIKVMNQTIGQQINWDFETNGKLVIKDKNGKLIYWENSNGRWTKHEYNSQGKEIYYEDSEGNVDDYRHKPSDDRVVEIDGVK